MKSNTDVPLASAPQSRDVPLASERDGIRGNIDAVLDFYAREEQKISPLAADARAHQSLDEPIERDTRSKSDPEDEEDSPRSKSS